MPREVRLGSSARLRWAVAFLLALALVAGAAWRLAASGAESFKGVRLEPPRPAPDFALVDQDGHPFRLSEARGQAVLLFFGYTSCPDVCPTTLAELGAVHGKLGSDAQRVQILFVTVDPERDAPERLKGYLRHFGAPIRGLTGAPEALEEVWRAYGVYAERQPVPGSAAGYLVAHSANVHLIDPQGRIRLLYPHGVPAEDILHDVRLLLRRAEG